MGSQNTRLRDRTYICFFNILGSVHNIFIHRTQPIPYRFFSSLDWGECIFLYYYQIFFSRPLTKPVERPSPSKHAPIINIQCLHNNNNNNNTIVLRAPSLIHAITPSFLPRLGANHYTIYTYVLYARTFPRTIGLIGIMANQFFLTFQITINKKKMFHKDYYVEISPEFNSGEGSVNRIDRLEFNDTYLL